MSKTTGLEIAVIGMACRFPGAKNIEEFWENMKTGTESITFSQKKSLWKPVCLKNSSIMRIMSEPKEK